MVDFWYFKQQLANREDIHSVQIVTHVRKVMTYEQNPRYFVSGSLMKDEIRNKTMWEIKYEGVCCTSS